MSVIVGTITIPEGRTFEQSYEVAAWHATIALTPGAYDVIATKPHGYVRLHAAVPGVYASVYTPSLFGGVAYGKEPQGEQHRDVGTTGQAILAVNFDDADLSAEGHELLAWYWIEAPRRRQGKYKDPAPVGLELSRQRTMIFAADVWNHEYRIDPDDGGLAEFTDSVPHLVERVNELIAAGHDPEVTRLYYGDDRKLAFARPANEHRSLYAPREAWTTA